MVHWLHIGHAVRALVYAVIALQLSRHVLRHRASLAATSGARFPTLYWMFAAILGCAAAEAVAAIVDPLGLPRFGFGMASDLAALATIDRLWRSQAESAALWRTPEGMHELKRAVDNIERLVRHRIARDERRTG